MTKNPLLDKNFLLELDKRNIKKKFAKIISLTLDEHPVEQIEGRITQGSINIDGASAVRRSCSLTIVADNLNIHDFNWGLKTKFILEIGIYNDFNSNYPEIIWFPQGTYVISSFGVSRSINNFNISIQGKDKMCLVNGELGGVITALTTDFGKYYDEITGEKKDLLIKDIVKYALHEWCFEPLHNIIINDLDETGLELLEYRGDKPLYLIREASDDSEKVFIAITLNGEGKNWKFNNEECSLNELKDKGFVFDNLSSLNINNPSQISSIKNETQKYYIAQINYGDGPVGYRETELTYAGDLVLALGQPVSAMLDNIVKMLGDFEYFYDLQGRFIFQRKKIYESKSWNTVVNSDNDIYVENAELMSPTSYSFDNQLLLQSLSNTPQLNNVKHDFSVWGTKKTVTGSETPIHMRYAIDSKPLKYTTYDGKIFTTIDNIDWREILYRMAIDYRKNHDKEDFEVRLAANNSDLFPTGKTGYEQYYVDMEGFWRQIYYYYTDDELPEALSYRPINYIANKEDCYVRPFILNTKSVKIKDLYIIDINNKKVYSYIDKIDFSDEEKRKYYSKINENYIPLLETLNISEKDLYYFKEDKYISIWDNLSLEEQKKIHIKIGNSYYPIWDYFNIWALKNNEESSHFYKKEVDSGKYKEIYIYYNGNKLTSVKEIKDNISQDLKYSLSELDEPIELIDLNNIYIYSTRDYLNQIFYISQIQEGKDETMIEYVNTLKHEDRKNLFYKDNLNYKSIYELLNISKDTIYIKKDLDYILLTEEVAEDGYLLPPSISEQKYNNDDSNYYYLVNNLPREIKELYLDKEIIYQKTNFLAVDIENSIQKDVITFYEGYTNFYTKDEENAYWNKEYIANPESLIFWIDFLDNDSELSQFSVKTIGDRAKTDNDSTVKAIYFKETPTILFVENLNSLTERKTGYTYIQLPSSMQGIFNISSQGKSAQEAIAQLIYNHAYRQESININCIPIYYLEPNTKIYVRDDDNKIDGYYIVNKISIPLGYNGMMNITANKAIEKLY